jgi:hypothetical protein
VILESINPEHRGCRAFITVVTKDKVPVLQLTTLSRLPMELHPQPALTTQGRTMADDDAAGSRVGWCSGDVPRSAVSESGGGRAQTNSMNIGLKWELLELRLLLL